MFIRNFLGAIALITLSLATGIQADSVTEHNRTNTDIVWDIDGVMLAKPSVSKKMWGHKWAMLKGMANPKLLYKALSSKSKETAEEWALFFEQQGQSDLAEMVRDIGYNKTPIEGTVEIIKELKAKGYTQNLATNMGSKDLAYFEKKYSFFKIFSFKNSVDYANGDTIKKPDRAYFEQYYGRNQKTKRHQIFIDDRKDNVKSARKSGMIAIHFKNPEQLKAELVRLGIL